jgi:hypothetical protein
MKHKYNPRRFDDESGHYSSIVGFMFGTIDLLGLPTDFNVKEAEGGMEHKNYTHDVYSGYWSSTHDFKSRFSPETKSFTTKPF